MDPVLEAQHFAVWSAIDELAAQVGCSTSALAKHAGLDATAFNRCARISASGLPRWSTRGTLAFVLATTGTSWADFGTYVDAIATGYVRPKARKRRRPDVASPHHTAKGLRR